MLEDEKRASSSASDRLLRETTTATTGRGEEGHEERPPAASSSSKSGRRRDEAVVDDDDRRRRMLLLEEGTSRGGVDDREESFTKANDDDEVRNYSKNQQQRFQVADKKYYSASKKDEDEERALFSRAIIAADKCSSSSRGVEYDRDGARCSSADNVRRITGKPPRPPATWSVSSSILIDPIDKSSSKMPAAAIVTRSTTTTDEPVDASKLGTLHANFSLPPSPHHRSSSSSTSDGGALGGGSSAFLAMAKRLHRLRLAAASPRHRPMDVEETTSCRSKESLHGGEDEEFVSIEPLQPSSTMAAVEEPPTIRDDHQMPQISSVGQNQRSIRADQRPLSRTSLAPSTSDVSIASFYRLPPAQFQTSDPVPLRSTEALLKNKVWTSEPILTPTSRETMSGNGAFTICNEDLTGGGIALEKRTSSARREGAAKDEDQYAAPFSTVFGSYQATTTSTDNAMARLDNLHQHQGRLMDSTSWLHRHQPVHRGGEPFTDEWNVPGAVGIRSTAHPIDLVGTDWSRPSEAAKGVGGGGPHAASLPPLAPGRIDSTRDGLSSHLDQQQRNNEVADATATNGRRQGTFPESISRLMEAVSKHPASDLDSTKLRAILREQRKSYKRRLERERAKREALEDLLVKLNTPRTQRHRSTSNVSSSTASTVRRRPPVDGNGRLSTNVDDVILNTLRSSIEGDSSTTTSDDAFLLELIQQHLRMKQALVGHRTNRAAGSLSTSGGEYDHRDEVHEATAVATRSRANVPNLSPPHSLNATDDDEIPVGGEAANRGTNLRSSISARLANIDQQTGNAVDHEQRHSKATKSRSMDFGQRQEIIDLGQLNGLIDKEALKLLLDTSSTGGSENGGRSSSSERRRERRKWVMNNSNGRSDRDFEREPNGHTPKMASGRTLGSSRPSVAFFVSANVEKQPGEAASVEMEQVKPLQNVFQERQSMFVRRSMARLDRIKAASELRSETARQVRELADNVAHGRLRMEDAHEQLLLFELPQPSAFSRLEMFRSSKMKYEQLPETVARRSKLKKESDLATNRIMAKMFKQKLAYKRLLKKAEKQSLVRSIPSSVASTNPNVRVLNR